MKKLTPKQQQVLDYIKGYISDNGFPPSSRNISDYFNFGHSAARNHLDALENKMAIRREFGKARAITVLI